MNLFTFFNHTEQRRGICSVDPGAVLLLLLFCPNSKMEATTCPNETTQQAHDVNTTSPQRRCNVASTLWRRCINVHVPAGYRVNC